MQYAKAEDEIIDTVIKISLKHEISKADTVAILTYLIHYIMHLETKESK